MLPTMHSTHPPGASSLMLLGMYGIGAFYTVIVLQTSGYAHGIGEGGVGCAEATKPKEFSLCRSFLC